MKPIKNDTIATAAMIGVLNRDSLLSGAFSAEEKPASSSLLKSKSLGERLLKIFYSS